MVKDCIERLHRSKLDGRSIVVERSQSLKKEEIVGFTAHISNLSFKLKEESELKIFLEERYGEIRRIHLVKDPASYAPHKGFAFVEFLDEKSLNKAVKDKEIMINDRLAIIKKSTRQITTN
jgi:RNA recognition motif-containing protein